MKMGKYFVLIALLTLLTFGLNGCNSNKEPVASFSTDPSSGAAPLEVVLDASSSGDEDGIIDSFEWDFGDGATSGGRVVEHTFSNDGEYTITLTVTDNDGATATTSKTVSVQNRKPSPQLQPEPTQGENPLEVEFDMSNSEDKDGVTEEYTLEFGDGSQAASGTDPLDLVTHTYEQSGEFTAKLSVVDDDGLENSTSKTITVENPPPPNKDPKAVMSANPTSGTVPVVVNFSAADSTDPDGEIESYEWSFGDGTMASGGAVSHRYENAGEFEVSLVVTDDRGGTSKTTATIEVEPATYYVGESASNDVVRLTVQDVEIGKTLGELEADAGREFVVVTVSVRALKDGIYPSKTLHFKLRDNNGRTQPIDLPATTSVEYLSSGLLDKDEVAQGKIVFEGRGSSDYYTLTYEAPRQSPIKFRINKE